MSELGKRVDAASGAFEESMETFHQALDSSAFSNLALQDPILQLFTDIDEIEVEDPIDEVEVEDHVEPGAGDPLDVVQGDQASTEEELVRAELSKILEKTCDNLSDYEERQVCKAEAILTSQIVAT